MQDCTNITFFSSEVIFGVQVKISGNVKKLEGPCLLIMNHRTRFDWMFVWCYLMRVGDLQKFKIVLKESLKNIPIVGQLKMQKKSCSTLCIYKIIMQVGGCKQICLFFSPVSGPLMKNA